jgi:hypothetical protein
MATSPDRFVVRRFRCLLKGEGWKSRYRWWRSMAIPQAHLYSINTPCGTCLSLSNGEDRCCERQFDELRRGEAVTMARGWNNRYSERLGSLVLSCTSDVICFQPPGASSTQLRIKMAPSNPGMYRC